MRGTPLYDDDAERAVLGSIVLNPEIVDDVGEMLRPEDFEREAHALTFSAMMDLAAQNTVVNTINLVNAVREAGDLGRVPNAMLVGLEFDVPANGNWRRYAQTVRELSTRRRLVQAASSIMESARDVTRKVDEVVSASEQAMYAVGERSVTKRPVMFRDALNARWNYLQALAERGAAITGVPSGMKAIDMITGGFQKKHLIIIAGRPSMGKSAVAMNIAVNAALTLNEGDGIVAVFSLEMGAGELVDRVLSSEGKVHGNRFRDGQFTNSDWPKMSNATMRVGNLAMAIDEEEEQTMAMIRSKCRRLARVDKGGLAMVVIDYIQYVKGDGRSEGREQEVAAISRACKALAKEFNCPVLALSQLNRSLEKREDKRPIMSDLRESGGLEQDADVCMFMYRDEVYNATGDNKGKAEAIFAKHRGGPTGTAHLVFDGPFTLFRDAPEEYGGYR